jgi:NADP-dependent 3-hydroxy acid dehydrogenase YdfG
VSASDADPTSPVTLVTGGSSGIGEGITRRLLAAGHRVVITGRRADRLAELAVELDAGPSLRTQPGHAADPEAVSSAVADAVENFGRLDYAVANAGFVVRDTLADGNPEGWREMILTNVLGPALLVRYALPALRESRGRFVFIGSLSGYENYPGDLYGATKWAVRAIAENTHLMLADEEIGVTHIAPGAVSTPGRRSDPNPDRPGRWPDDRAMSPDELADIVLWTLTQPRRVNINTVAVRPLGQK